jgi:hypothetical protein
VRWIALLAGAALVTACGAGSGLHVENGGRTLPVAVATTDTQPTSGGGQSLPHQVTARVPLGGVPAICWDGSHTLWAAVWGGGPHLIGSLVPVDTSTARAGTTFALPASPRPYLIAAAADAVDIAAGSQLLQLDPATGHVVHSIDLGSAARALLLSRSSLWLTLDDGSVLRLSPATLAVRDRLHITGSPEAITTSPGSVFVTDDQARDLVRARASTGKVTDTVPIAATGAGPPSQITVYADSIWVYEGSSVVRLLLRTTRLVDRLSLPGGGGSIAAGTGGVWVSGSFGVARIDPATGQVTTPVDVGAAGAAIATTGDAVWVVQRAGGVLLRLSP